MAGGMHGKGACVAGEMATAAASMHPTGMHSCLSCYFGHTFFYFFQTLKYLIFSLTTIVETCQKLLSSNF